MKKIEIVQHTGKKAASTIEALLESTKRFYVPATVKLKCPSCGQESEHDLSEDYFSYPEIGKPFTETFYCRAMVEEDTPCEEAIDVKLRIDVDVKLTAVR